MVPEITVVTLYNIHNFPSELKEQNSQSNLANPSYKDEAGESKTMGRS